MLLNPLLAVTLAFLSQTTVGQEQKEIMVLDAEHNATTIVGVWSSGGGLVQTGPSFVDVQGKKFFPPPAAGISYAFTEDMYFEQVEYRFTSNPADPNCPNATLLFQHGTYEHTPYGEIILNPFTSDGLVQTQTPCGKKSSLIQQFNATITIAKWRIWIDRPTNNAHLHLFRFDGAPYTKMLLRTTDARSSMMPTETIVPIILKPPRRRRRSEIPLVGAAPSGRIGVVGAVVAVAGAVLLGTCMVVM